MTSSFRVTLQGTSTNLIAGLQRNQDQLTLLTNQLSSGQQLTKPSDSPTGVVSAMELRSQLAQQQQYTRSATDGLARLSTAETALTNASNQLNTVHDLVLQGMSATASGSPTTMQALASQVDSIRSSLLSLANTTYLNRPVFGGTTAGTVAFDSNGNYVGDDGQVLRRVGDGLQVRADVPAAAWGTGTSQLFGVLSQISTDLKTNPSALSGDLDRLNSGMDQVTTALSSLGARYGQIQTASTTATSQTATLTAQLSDIEDVDVAKASVDLETQNVGYQAALAAAARVVQPSLLDFLK